MKTVWFALVLLTLTAGAAALGPRLDGTEAPVPSAEPVRLAATQAEIEVVFVLDTTGSMGGLIAAAKEKIWSIATTMAQADPAPTIRMGLVAYRDRGDQYVTRLTPLSEDLDQVYGTLMEYSAEGGGDTPESVAAGLNRALTEGGWSQKEGVYRVIFLVGDAPPKRYQDEPGYAAVVRQAAAQGIIVNTIRCGTSHQTETVWRQIAGLAQGEFFTVGQDGDALAIVSPFDAELADLSAQLDATRLAFGDGAAKEAAHAKDEATLKLHAEGSVAARARRATFNASKAGHTNLYGKHDLLSALAEGTVSLDELQEEALPEVLKPMAPAARAAYVESRQSERDALNQRIEALAEKRDAYLSKRAEALDDVEESLDYKLGTTVMRQAAEKGMAYEDTSAPKL